MSKVRTDFYFTYSSEKLKAARERLRISQGETARRAQIRDGTYNGYEREQLKRSADQTPARLPLRSGARSLSCSIIMKRQGCIFHPAKPES